MSVKLNLAVDKKALKNRSMPPCLRLKLYYFVCPLEVVVLAVSSAAAAAFTNRKEEI